MGKIRDYRVPFSTSEDEKLVFNLSTKECLWFGAGVISSIVVVGIPALILQLSLPKIVYLLPLALPTMGICSYMALKKVNEFDKLVKVDVSIWNKFKYKRRAHNYCLFRKQSRGGE